MGNDNRIFADMAIHALEMDLIDLYRLAQSHDERTALRSDLTRIVQCSARLSQLIALIRVLEEVPA